MWVWQKETATGRTKEEALSKLDDLMIRKHPNEPFSTDFAKISEYDNKNSDENYIAEYIF